MRDLELLLFRQHALSLLLLSTRAVEPSAEPSVDGSGSTDDDGSQSALASILEEGIGLSASPSRTVTSRLHDAAQELDLQLRAIREGEERSLRDRGPDRAAAAMARHLPDLAAALGSEPLAAASPISEIEVQPRGHRGILAAAEVAGVDPRMQNLLLHSAPGAQQDVMKTMLHRMAALEQRQRDAESSNAHARQAMSGGVLSIMGARIRGQDGRSHICPLRRSSAACNS